MENKLLSIKETAEFLKTKESTVRTWIRRKQVPPEIVFRCGNAIRIRYSKLLNWVNGDECLQS